MAKVIDRASMVSDQLLLFLENCRERYIKNVERINSQELDSIRNSCCGPELSSRQQKLNDCLGLKKVTEACTIIRWRLQGKKFGLILLLLLERQMVSPVSPINAAVRCRSVRQP